MNSLPSVYCVTCGRRVAVRGDTRRAVPQRLYCSDACRQRAYRQRVARRRTTPTASAPALPDSPWGSAAIPRQLGKFVGRDRELRLLANLSANTLLTITGPPGVGKSRLAHHHVRRMRELQRLTRVRWADLAPAALAGDGQSHSITETLRSMGDGHAVWCDANREHPSTLVVDNADVDLDECAKLVMHLVSACPQMKILITSREPLRVPGEVVFGLNPLPLPPATEHPTIRDLLQSDAMQLFVERASTGNPGFTLSEHNAHAVAEVCRELDGVPLFLELAASRVGILSITELLSRLRQPVTVLTSGSRTASVRHSSFRAALDASYDLLDDQERAVFRQLSVLSEPFGLGLAMAVCGFDERGEANMIELLARLQAKSLLIASTNAFEQTEFRQLTPIRHYGSDRLDAAGETDEVWDRLATWTTAAARQVLDLRPGFGPPPSPSIQHYIARTAEWAMRRDDQRTVPLAAALVRYGTALGQSALVQHLSHRALLLSCDDTDRVRLLTEMAAMQQATGNVTGAESLSRQAVLISRRLPDRRLHRRALVALAASERALGHLADAQANARQALQLAQSGEDPEGVAECVESLATTAAVAGRLTEAARLVVDLTRVLRSLDGAAAAGVQCALGEIALLQGDVHRAEQHALDAARGLRDAPELFGRPLVLLAVVALRRGDRRRTLYLLQNAHALRNRLGHHHTSPLESLVETELRGFVSSCDPGEVAQARSAADSTSTDFLQTYALSSSPMDQPVSEPSADSLTRRQLVIAMLVAEGFTNRQIANRIGASPRTVAAELARIRSALHLRSRAQLAGWAQAILR
ncbi:LuxR family transcriptional regulator [Micromonospora sp. ATCC 39149]|uniref:HTH luxR-type domain-containing protein n=1 Tax=Micromonospora carbonacea TaxID=47853 RepID=A0A7D5Y6K0_9ACTN|nr:LuxR C-terminal-related transcriptional regulator [Micromonospora sp. ATCC 39149]EEP70237.1 LuxR family transcriptional regulator [Micromonospora sp. ATCC 39149]QLJ96661.1 hypothetical protein HZU44_17230 [Micromonospora carbonacea]